MSRVAKKPINLPKGVELNIQPESVSVKGPKGTLSLNKSAGVEITIDNGVVTLNPKDISFDALTGTVRSILANMVKGVSEGFEKKLELVGVGYRAAMQGKDLNLSLGFSHPAGRHHPGHSDADGNRRAGRGQAGGRRSRRQDPWLPPAGALQGQGCEVRR